MLVNGIDCQSGLGSITLGAGTGFNAILIWRPKTPGMADGRNLFCRGHSSEGFVLKFRRVGLYAESLAARGRRNFVRGIGRLSFHMGLIVGADSCCCAGRFVSGPLITWRAPSVTQCFSSLGLTADFLSADGAVDDLIVGAFLGTGSGNHVLLNRVAGYVLARKDQLVEGDGLLGGIGARFEVKETKVAGSLVVAQDCAALGNDLRAAVVVDADRMCVGGIHAGQHAVCVCFPANVIAAGGLDGTGCHVDGEDGGYGVLVSDNLILRGVERNSNAVADCVQSLQAAVEGQFAVLVDDQVLAVGEGLGGGNFLKVLVAEVEIFDELRLGLKGIAVRGEGGGVGDAGLAGLAGDLAVFGNLVQLVVAADDLRGAGAVIGGPGVGGLAPGVGGLGDFFGLGLAAASTGAHLRASIAAGRLGGHGPLAPVMAQGLADFILIGLFGQEAFVVLGFWLGAVCFGRLYELPDVIAQTGFQAAVLVQIEYCEAILLHRSCHLNGAIVARRLYEITIFYSRKYDFGIICGVQLVTVIRISMRVAVFVFLIRDRVAALVGHFHARPFTLGIFRVPSVDFYVFLIGTELVDQVYFDDVLRLGGLAGSGVEPHGVLAVVIGIIAVGRKAALIELQSRGLVVLNTVFAVNHDGVICGIAEIPEAEIRLRSEGQAVAVGSAGQIIAAGFQIEIAIV